MDIVDAARIKKPEGYLDHYAIGLLFAEPPRVDMAALEDALRQGALAIQQNAGNDAEANRPTLHVLPPNSEAAIDHTIVIAEDLSAKPPPEGNRKVTGDTSAGPWQLTPLTRDALTSELLEPAVEQSWWWPDGRGRVSQMQYLLELRDQGADPEVTLSWQLRLSQTQEVLAAVLTATEATPCVALHWLPSQQLIDPQEACSSWLADGFSNPLPGAINVRFYRIDSGSATGRGTGRGPDDDEYLMDTLGLSAVGLRDLQCHFRGIDPDEVSSTLYQAALYQWERGAVLEDGHTVEGPREQDEWLCRSATSKGDPRRSVIDLDPGFPFSVTPETPG